MLSLSTEEIEYQRAHLKEDKRAMIIGPSVVFLVAAYIAVILRFASRRIARTAYKQDDWWILGGLVSTTAYVISYCVTIRYGMGKHVILLTDAKGFTVTAIIAETFYNISIPAIKLSILFLYRRIFPQQWFKQVLILTGSSGIAYSLAQVFGDIFQCFPINSAWNPNVTGRCIDYGAFVLTMGIINTLTDFIILALPMPLLWRLKLSNTRKWMLTITFALGGFVSITSIVRLFFVRKVGSRDPTIDDVDGATISAAECCVGIISACLPTYRPLYIRYRHGRIEARDTRATPKAYGNKSTESKHLKSLRSKSAADSNKGYSREYGGLYKQLGNKTDVEYQSDERQMMGTSDNIFVTKTFASSNSRFGGNFGEL